MNFIELPKFHKGESELETATDKWLFFLKHASSLDTIPAWADSVGLRQAYQTAEEHNWNRKELELYDYWSKKEGEQRDAVEEAWEAGEKRGMEKGKLDVARNLLKRGLGVELVSDATQLSVSEIEQLMETEPVSG